MTAAIAVESAPQSWRGTVLTVLLAGLAIMAILLWPLTVYVFCCSLLLRDIKDYSNDNLILCAFLYALAATLCIAGALHEGTTIGAWRYLLWVPYVLGAILTFILEFIMAWVGSLSDPDEDR